jgi:hypothetical protein
MARLFERKLFDVLSKFDQNIVFKNSKRTWLIKAEPTETLIFGHLLLAVN